MQRLAALVPRPRLHLIRFGGRITSLREMSVPRFAHGVLKIIAAILERPTIEKILNHLGLEARAPPRAPACGQMSLQDF